jgi:hypothetical protein
MKTLVRSLVAVFFLFIGFNATAQCGAGETEITITLYTDAWGYECYWELYPQTNTCGENPYLSGGNADQVGCFGAGEQDSSGGNGYANFATIEAGPVCVPTGEPIVLQFIDDWGDGGTTFEIFEDGQFVGFYNGSGSGNTWVFTPGENDIPSYDEPCAAEPIEIDGPSLFLNNAGAIAAFDEVTPGGGNCDLPGVWCEGGVTNSVWASFTGPDEGGVEITTCLPGTEMDTQIALWSGADCNDQSSFELVAANDDMFSGCGNGNGFASTMYAGCLQPGETYFIQIDGWNGATGNFELQVSSYADAPLLNAVVNNIPCAVGKGEEGNGSIQPYFIGFGEQFEASWEGPAGFTADSQNIDGLNPGEYVLTATTACGEVYTETFEVTMPAPLTATFAIEHPQCPQSADGMVTPTVNGGALPYSYEWTGPDDYTSGMLNPDDMNEGTYTLVITDNNDCTFEQNITLTATNVIDLNLGQDTEICTDDVLVLSGPVGYNYLWQDGSNNQFFVVDGEALGEGSYNFVLNVSNDEGCDVTDAVSVDVVLCNSVEELTRDLKIFPNPAADVVNITGLPQQTDLTLRDAVGRLVLTQQVLADQTQLDVSALAPGQYILTVAVGEVIQHMQLMIR